MQSKLDFKSRRHAVKCLAVDAENFRGAFAIAARRIQNVEDVTPFQFVEARQCRKDYYDWNGTRVYDAENRMATASNGVTDGYSYDGGGKRVRRNIAGAETWQVYGLGGELIAEYAANADQALVARVLTSSIADR